MTVTPTNFRDSYPEFMDQAAYPDSAISFWIAVAAGVPGPPQVPGLLNQCRWGRQFDLATPYFEGMYETRHLPIPADLRGNVEYRYYPSGHMVYANEASLKALHSDVADFIQRTAGNAASSSK